MTTSKAIAVLCALCALSALPAHARVFDARPVGEDVNPYCKTCQVQDGQRYQLIRGEDEVKLCTDHVYCDCQEQRQLKCAGLMSAWASLNPDKQVCTLMFSCADWFRNHPTTTSTAGPTGVSTVGTTTNSPETPTTTSSQTTTTSYPSHPYCLTCQVVGDQRYQLIRGEDEVKLCTDHVYCDCQEQRQLKCAGLMSAWASLNPDKQVCTLMFSCANWLRDHPTTISTAGPTAISTVGTTTNSPETPTTTSSQTTTTSYPSHPYCLTCQVVGDQRYQLIRGEDEVKLCTDHVYCDCQEQRQLKCAGLMSAWASLNPDKQVCTLMFSCANWLRDHPTTISTAGPTAISTVGTTTNSPEPPTTTSSQTTTTSYPSHPYCLTCQVVGDQRYQLIRGEDEVKLCTDHVYCDCQEQRQLKCAGLMSAWASLNPDKQVCTLMFSCANWLRDHPTTISTAGPTAISTVGTTTNSPEPPTTTSSQTTTTPNPSHPYCLTCQVVGDQRYQLIRGEDELQQCEDHVYCDCVDHKQMKCGGMLAPLEWFNPDKQECAMGFSCADWLLAPTTISTNSPEPPTTTSSQTTTTPNPSHPYCLTCQVVGDQRYQLIRGEDELQQCEDHVYCDCVDHKQMKCGGMLAPLEWFNPDKQECAMGFSCADWLLAPTTISTNSPEPPTTTSSQTTTPTTTPNPSHPYCLICDGGAARGDRYQLIRGEDELQQCEDHVYCDCVDHKQMKCGGMLGPLEWFNPDKQECVMGFSCADWLLAPTTTTTEASTTTSTKVPTTTSTALPTTTTTEIPTTTWTVAPTTTTTEIPTTTSTESPTTTSTKTPSTTSTVAPTSTSTDVPTTTSTEAFTTSSPQDPATNPTTTSTRAPFRLDSIVICRS